jgi:iron-sulfur cluster assembly protein
MLTLTSAAAEEILRAAREAGMEEPLLRVAARADGPGGEVEYGMGFDERREQDEEFDCGGVIVLVSPPSREPLAGTVLDYVEIEPDQYRFIFSHPKHVAPESEPQAGQDASGGAKHGRA